MSDTGGSPELDQAEDPPQHRNAALPENGQAEGPPQHRHEAPQEMHRERADDFKRLPMVSWFNPFQLADTAYRAVAASLFGAYADKRDVMAAGRAAKVCAEFAGRDEVCIDYVADVGDGWASTYSVAWLLAQEKNGVPRPMGVSGKNMIRPPNRLRIASSMSQSSQI